jgi:hypothetical protein
MSTPDSPPLLGGRVWLAWCCYLGGASRGEIAEWLEISPETVLTYLKRARRRLGVRPGATGIEAARYPFGRAPSRERLTPHPQYDRRLMNKFDHLGPVAMHRVYAAQLLLEQTSGKDLEPSDSAALSQTQALLAVNEQLRISNLLNLLSLDAIHGLARLDPEITQHLVDDALIGLNILPMPEPEPADLGPDVFACGKCGARFAADDLTAVAQHRADEGSDHDMVMTSEGRLA